MGTAILVPADLSASNTHSITIDDVLAMEHLDQATLSPDGDWIAAVIQRGAKNGEVYGRTAYETDPSRNDIWLVSRSTHERRNLTNGSALAAGFWCASWSPDGRRLAMLSTRPEAAEPRGGDNVRLYVWDRDQDKLSRLGDVAMMTQTRFGGAIHRLDLRGGADHANDIHSCGDENAPYVWLDEHRLLAVTLPAGHVSPLIDEASRPFRIDARDSQRLHGGMTATGEAFGSGAARMPPSSDESAVLQTVDTTTRAWNVLATVPDYPFAADLTISVAPDLNKAAVIVPVSAFQPAEGQHFPHLQSSDWAVEKRAGLIDLSVPSPVHWLSMPSASPYPLELLAWSPDSRRVALRSRRDGFDAKPTLVLADVKTGRVTSLASTVMDQAPAGSIFQHEQQLYWIDASNILARLRDPDGKRLDWWHINRNGSMRNLTANHKAVLPSLKRLAAARFAGIEGKTLVSFDGNSGKTSPFADIGAEAGSFVSTTDMTSVVVKTSDADEHQILHQVDSAGSLGPAVMLPSTATLINADKDGLLWQHGDRSGLFLQDSNLRTGQTAALLKLDTGLASIAWGNTIFFDYKTTDGQAVKGAALLPPGYKAGQRYPTLVWAYEGYSVDPNGDFFLDPQAPGAYNLQLYAAKGYVVLVPSMPFPAGPARDEVYAAIPNGVMPAIDKLNTMGIADPDRVGVFGQSYGGYSVYALVSQSDRFKAGVAMAGITDMQGYYDQADPLARGYPGIGHEMSANWIIADQFGLHGPPASDHDRYWRNSPLGHTNDVHTPLLMLHGTQDIRGSITQADQFFYELYSQGKTARLVRFGGESHGLDQSPANIKKVFQETVEWFDRYVRSPQNSSN